MEIQDKNISGGEIVFSVPVPREDSNAARAERSSDGSIRIASATSSEVLRLCSNGDIFVRGVLAENDRQVVDGLREFLRYTMKLFLVTTNSRSSYSRNLVEAESEELAVRIIHPNCTCAVPRAPSLHCPDHGDLQRTTDVERIELRGTPGIRWCEEESPDSPREQGRSRTASDEAWLKSRGWGRFMDSWARPGLIHGMSSGSCSFEQALATARAESERERVRANVNTHEEARRIVREALWSCDETRPRRCADLAIDALIMAGLLVPKQPETTE